MEDAFGTRPGVREDEGVGVSVDEFVQAVVESGLDEVAWCVDEIVGRTLETQVELASEASVHDLVLAGLAAGRFPADEELGDRLQGFDGGRTADPGEFAIGERREPFETHRQVRATLVRRQRVDLVDDDVLDGPELLAELRRVEQDGERLRRGVEDVRGLLEHPLAFARGGVAVADRVTDLADVVAAILDDRGDSLQRNGEVAVDVVCERFQRRDVQTVHRVLESVVEFPVASKELVDDRRKTRECLAAARRCTDECVRPVVDLRNGLALGKGEEAAVFGDVLAELPEPPLLDGRFQPIEDVPVDDLGVGVERQLLLVEREAVRSHRSVLGGERVRGFGHRGESEYGRF